MSNQFTFTGPSPGPPSTNVVVKWTFFDPMTSATATFEINPNQAFTPDHERTISSQHKLFPGGRTTLYANANAAQEVNFSGEILTETAYNQLVTWFNKTDTIELTDDLGRTYPIIITKFDAKRVYKGLVPWYHTYDVTATIIDT